MGAKSNRVEVLPEPLAAYQRGRDGAGAPMLATVGKAPTSSQSKPVAQGYAKSAEDSHTADAAPTLFVGIRYIYAGQSRTVQVPWRTGLTVQHAWRWARIHDDTLRASRLTITSSKLARVIDQRRVKMTTVMVAGDLLRLNPREKPFL